MVFHLWQAWGHIVQDAGGPKHEGHFRRPPEETGGWNLQSLPLLGDDLFPPPKCQTIISGWHLFPFPPGIPGKPLTLQMPRLSPVFTDELSEEG
jgi:hypothetical protein